MRSEPHRATLVCALPSEAAPLIERWRLPCACEKPFKVYASPTLRVIVSGVGAYASAAAVGFAAGLERGADAEIWLNVGIAGHGELALGSALLAHRVRAEGSAQAWYPSLLFATPCSSADVITYERPITTYPAQAACDMEAAGFMAAAARVGHGDLVQVLKVVSDNAAAALETLDRARVRALIENQIEVLEAVLAALRALARDGLPAWPDSGLAAILERWHFTHAQATQLRQLRRRHAALAGDAAWADIELGDPDNAAGALALIRAEVEGLPLRCERTP